jgi:hypothetical protein
VDCDEGWGGFESGDESVEEIEQNALKSLCGDLMEEFFDESSFPVHGEQHPGKVSSTLSRV